MDKSSLILLVLIISPGNVEPEQRSVFDSVKGLYKVDRNDDEKGDVTYGKGELIRVT